MNRFCVILLLYFNALNNINGAPVSADITNTTGDYYFLYKGTNNNKEIACINLAGCYIKCIDQDSCDTANITASSTNYLTLICEGKY